MALNNVGGDAGERGWLKNLSYVPPSTSRDGSYESSSSGSSTCSTSYSKHKKKKKKKRKLKQETVEKESKKVQSSLEGFRIDHKPEFDNLRYDSVYSGDVATYRRRFDCLGLRPSQVLKWTDGRSKVSKRKKAKGLRREGRYFVARLKCEASGVMIIKKEGQPSGLEKLSDFISLESALKKDWETSDESLTAERQMTILTGEYNSSLLEQPHNVSLWLEFLAFQNQLLEWGHLPGESTDHTSRKKQALVERKLSIYERALQQNPMSVDLLLGYMALAREKLEMEEILRKWKDIVFRQPNQPSLWLGYIHFCQTNFSSFKTSSVGSIYCKCINTLLSIMEGDLKSHQPLPDTPIYLLAIFYLYCTFLKQAGLVERAVASYQALVEFNLCCPLQVDGSSGASLKAAKEFFEAYWDSGVARLGERGAVGWSNWSEANHSADAGRKPLGILPDDIVLFGKGSDRETNEDDMKDEEDVEMELVSGLQFPEAWRRLEDYRTSQHCFPWSPDTAKGETIDDCADPDRIVMFDDVSQALFRISDPNLKLTLVLSFLNFLGAPVSEPISCLSRMNDAARFETLNDALPGARVLLRSGDEVCDQQQHFPSGIGVLSSLPNYSSLIELAGGWSTFFLEPVSLDSTLSTAASNDWILNMCNQSLTLLPSASEQTAVAQVLLSQLHTRLLKKSRASGEPTLRSLKSEIRRVEKVFKELLRLEQHRNNLPLWNSYALFQYSLGNFKDAKKLYQSVLSLMGIISLDVCCTLCECFMGLRWCLKDSKEGGIDHDFALHALVCFSEHTNLTTDSVISPGRILKARNYFSSSSERASSSPDGIGVTLCYCYFEYLTRGLQEACAVLDSWSTKLRDIRVNSKNCKTSESLKTILLKKMHLLERHSLTHPMASPVMIKSHLQEALGMFPEQSEFLAAFICHERQSFISGRMRRFFDKAVEDTESVLPWLFAIVAEFDRFSKVTGKGRGSVVEELSVGTVCRMLSLLSRATGSVAGRHCPLLWRLYMAVQVMHTKWVSYRILAGGVCLCGEGVCVGWEGGREGETLLCSHTYFYTIFLCTCL